MHSKFHFLPKIDIKMTYLVFLFCFLLSLRLQSHLEVVLQLKILNVDKTKRLPNGSRGEETVKKKHKVSHFHFYFFQGMEVRTYFVYFRTQTQSPTNSQRVWVACGLTEQKERYFLLQVTSNSEYGFLFTWNGLR